MKSLPKILAVIVIVVALLVVCRNYIIKSAVESGARVVTGLKLGIGKFDLGASKILIQDMKLHNPGGFPEDPVMVDIPEIFADYEISEFLKGTVHLTEVRFHLKELVVVKNKDGKLNLDSLKQIQQAKKDGDKSKDKRSEPVKVKVDNLSLHVERVTYKDYSVKDGPSIKHFDIELKEESRDIQDLNAVIATVMFKAISKTSIAALTNIDLKELGGFAGDTLKNTTQAAASALEGAGKTTKDTLNNTADGIKNIFKNTLGDK